MKRTILPIFLLLALSACQERNAISMPAPKMLPAEETIVEKPIIIKNVEAVKIPQVKKPVKRPLIVKPHKTNGEEIFSGGIMTDGLDIGMLRLGKEGSTTRLVLDSYKWNINSNIPSIRSHEVGYYMFTYNPVKKSITAVINGYRGFSALHGRKMRTFGSDAMVKKLSMVPYLDDSGFKFIIQLKQNAKINVFDLKGPGRIIIDISPQ
jgi:hypothetical protein